VKKSRAEEWIVIYITAAVAVFLFVYLTVAMIRPEWF
jgi:K+-transporting ATPase KdpF subunit